MALQHIDGEQVVKTFYKGSVLWEVVVVIENGKEISRYEREA